MLSSVEREGRKCGGGDALLVTKQVPDVRHVSSLEVGVALLHGAPLHDYEVYLCNLFDKWNVGPSPVTVYQASLDCHRCRSLVQL